VPIGIGIFLIVVAILFMAAPKSTGNAESLSAVVPTLGEIRLFCKLQDEGQSLMRAVMSQLNLSARVLIIVS